MFTFYITKNLFGKVCVSGPVWPQGYVADICKYIRQMFMRDTHFRQILLLLVLCPFFLLACGPAKRNHIETSSGIRDLRVVEAEELNRLEYQSKSLTLEDVLAAYDRSGKEGILRPYFLQPVRLHAGRVNVIEDVDSTSRIYTGGQDGKVYEVSLKEDLNGKNVLVSKILAEGSRPIHGLSASPDGKYLAVSQFSVISVINIQNRTIEAQFHRVKGRILSMAWDVNSSMLLLGRANGDIFSWNIGDDVSKASDSTNVLEFYETNPSPVIKMVFHPSGRAFFAALQSGSVYLIRLVKTERDLGLRLDTSKPGVKQGKYVVLVGKIPSSINDMILDVSTDQLLVSGADGSIHRWRLRGLRKALPYPTGSDSTGFISMIHPGFSHTQELQEEESSTNSVLGTLGRNLRIRLWCTEDEVYELEQPTSSVIKKSDLDIGQPELQLKSSEDDILDQLKKELFAEIANTETLTPEKEKVVQGLIIESPRFLETVIAGRYSGSRGIIWIGEKTGALVGFDVKGFLSSNQSKTLISNVCR